MILLLFAIFPALMIFTWTSFWEWRASKRMAEAAAQAVERQALKEYTRRKHSWQMPAPEPWFDPARADFWNDPKLWNGITDPHKQMCWMKPRTVDVIDVRRVTRASDDNSLDCGIRVPIAMSAPKTIRMGGPTIASVKSGNRVPMSPTSYRVINAMSEANE